MFKPSPPGSCQGVGKQEARRLGEKVQEEADLGQMRYLGCKDAQ